MRRGSGLAMQGAVEPERVGGEYQVVSLRPSPGAVSVGFALIAVLSRQILSRVLFGWLSWVPTNAWQWPIAVAGTAFGAGLVGLAFGLVGLRRRRDYGRSLAVFGLVANATVVVLLGLMVLAFVYVRFR